MSRWRQQQADGQKEGEKQELHWSRTVVRQEDDMKDISSPGRTAVEKTRYIRKNLTIEIYC